MQSVISPTTTEVRIGDVVAVRLTDDLSWGQGAIQPQAGLDDDTAQQQLLEAVIASLSPVSAEERRYSSCTDGRLPVRLLNGEPVPVREQNVGTDTMLLFHMAEALGARFYKDPAASLRDRLQEVVSFMGDAGLIACTHVACGAAAGYVAITQNLVTFTTNPQFIARQQALLPAGVYDQALREQLTAGYADRLAKGVYDTWSAALVTEVIQAASGDRAIAELNDDGRGVHGHVEEQIVRVQLEDEAINEAEVSAQTDGREVFGVSDTRMQRLARLISRGQEQEYKLALMAAEDFTDGGHGTLAKNLPTYILRKA